MSNNNFDDLFKKIREAPKEEAEEVFKRLMEGNMRGAIVAIASRNFSHGCGKHACKKCQCKKTKTKKNKQ
jgi:hypothetical protein